MPKYNRDPIKTNKDKLWLYEEYYSGNKDKEDRRSGDGENHWSGAASLEWYTGRFLRDTMHGIGDYHWRFLGPEGLFVTYEGAFFVNKMHGYGIMSYPDGRVFKGLYHGNMRWGPGVESHADLNENVGLWRGRQLVRLAWRPAAPAIVPDLIANPNSKDVIEPHRILLAPSVKTIGEVNSAIDLLKSYGVNPMAATKRWQDLYAKHCTDMRSVICHRELFERAYYGDSIHSLREVSGVPKVNADSKDQISHEEGGSDESTEGKDKSIYFAWNNNPMMVQMMKHCYTSEYQRKDEHHINLLRVLSGPRSRYKPAGKHEIQCRTLLMSSYLGHIVNVIDMVNEHKVYPDISDMQGNTALMYATCGNKHDVMHFLVEAGAAVNALNDACCTPLAIALVCLAVAEHDIPAATTVQNLLPSTRPTSPIRGKGDQIKEEARTEWKISRDLPQAQPPTMQQKIPNFVETNGSLVGRNTSMTSVKSTSKREAEGITRTSTKLERSLSRLDQTPSKVEKLPTKTKSQLTIKPETSVRWKSEQVQLLIMTKLQNGETEYNSETNIFKEDQMLYRNIAHEYQIRVNNLFFEEHRPVQYLFYVPDLVAQLPDLTEESKKTLEKNSARNESKLVKLSSKNLRATSKLLHTTVTENPSFDDHKNANLAKIKGTILQLLSDGADPKLVRCPQPALVLGISTRDSDIIRKLVQYGADVNEKYPQIRGYSPLIIAISQPLTQDTLDVVRALLESGARADGRIPCEDSDSSNYLPSNLGPTLLHWMLEKKPEDFFEAEVRKELLELLLHHGSDPLALYRGRSPLYQALTRHRETLLSFIQSPNTNINGIINISNESVLITIFNLEFFKALETGRLLIVENLLLHGADPLLECESGGIKYQNLFVYTTPLLEIMKGLALPVFADPSKKDLKKKDEKASKDTKKAGKSEDGGKAGKGGKVDKGRRESKASPSRLGFRNTAIEEYSKAVGLAMESARMMHVKWIQGRLVKELALVVDKYKQRTWHMIMKEHDKQQQTGLWVNSQRCLEIWQILQTTRNKLYKNTRTLQLLLCIVEYYNTKHSLSPKLTFKEKEMIDAKICELMRTHKINTIMDPLDVVHSTRFSTYPELDHSSEKFNVCFECSTPLTDDILPCIFCNLVSFCNFDCMKSNVQRINSHPCSPYLETRYFPPVILDDVLSVSI